jgi:hypothetical protein
MRRTLAFVVPIFLAGAILPLPELAVAQHRGMHAGAPGVMGTSRASLGRSVHRVPVYGASPRLGVRIPVAQSSARLRAGSGSQPSISARHTRHLNIVPFDNFGETDFGDVPGLGFDFPHLAAISGHRHFGHERFRGAFPFGFGGFLLPNEPVILEEAQPGEAARQNEDDVTADASEADPSRESRSQRRGSLRSSPAQAERSSAAPAQAGPDAAEYVFVRRDGELLFAVAYTWQNGTLRYITRDGIRNTVAVDALDLTATEQFNEQRGLTFHLPA